MPSFLAHVGRDRDALSEHPLEEHLRAVGDLAKFFAEAFGAGAWGELAGVWHDLGKYRPGFQRYIRGSHDPDAHIEHKVRGPEKTHSAAGAIHALETFKRRFGRQGEFAARVLTYVIAGHHAGLYDWKRSDGEGGDLCDRLFQFGGGYAESAQREYDEARADAPHEILEAGDAFDPVRATRLLPGVTGNNPIAYAFAVRMLFSCLVDADFLDTERFLDQARFEARSRNIPTMAELAAAFDAFTQRRDAHLKANGTAARGINEVRTEILAQCRGKATRPRGLFSLEVPTGGGKTLSSLAFALSHALRHGMRGIIYVIPYTSIVEQTADVFRRVFESLGDAAIVEHHSQADSDPTRETTASRVACENWDAPLVVTTNVQLFESMFAARTSRCRKLHNLTNSVIVLDEAQQLPPRFLQPVLDALNLLVDHYRCTVVLCTATQPVLESTDYFDARRNLRGLPAPTPIVEDVPILFDKLQRVEVDLPRDWDERRTLVSLAEDIGAHDCVLAVVDRKADARELHALLPEGALHLSAWMCGAHRADTIAHIKRRLAARRDGGDEEPLRVVSTQLVEAGVDLDFPVVYRALAGLDSIAQAAGRCNREGFLERGKVVVFVPPKEPPVGELRTAAQASRSVLHSRPAQPLSPGLFREYFRHFYAGCALDAKQVVELLRVRGGDPAVKFRSAAEAFRLIDEDTVPVIVRYRAPDDDDDSVGKLLAVLAGDGPSRWLLRSLQRYAVMVHRRRAEALAAQGSMVPAPGLPGWYVQASDLLYHPLLGLDPDDDAYDPARHAI